eukprot:CAMPEP_0197615508 /NCGR_PEP_ID=MMETSP1326-20131121/60065_1 /TAXON_ID=1155430 /ORGANISM="Genus nov. species nov., Strain RCC2288" /LENGTH=270 /DNA_ID=CAMNT_0043184389 /DNA_START=203 /DNA_END=1015 /DNA_ORIENTATION=-
MSSVPFHEALATLENMFPELDVVVIRDVLDARGGHMESTVEELLAMSRAKRGIGGGGASRSGGGGSRGGAGDAPGANSMGQYSRGQSSGSGDIYSNVPPPRQDDGSIWGWLTGTEDEVQPVGRGNGGGQRPGGGGGAEEEEDTFTWMANSANFYAGELTRNVKSMTDAIAEELLGPAEDEEGEEIEEEDEDTRGTGSVVAGGATVKANKRLKKKDAVPKEKKAPGAGGAGPKKKEEEEDDDAIGGFLNLLGLDDEEDEEVFVRRDCKKDK